MRWRILSVYFKWNDKQKKGIIEQYMQIDRDIYIKIVREYGENLPNKYFTNFYSKSQIKSIPEFKDSNLDQLLWYQYENIDDNKLIIVESKDLGIIKIELLYKSNRLEKVLINAIE